MTVNKYYLFIIVIKWWDRKESKTNNCVNYIAAHLKRAVGTLIRLSLHASELHRDDIVL